MVIGIYNPQQDREPGIQIGVDHVVQISAGYAVVGVIICIAGITESKGIRQGEGNVSVISARTRIRIVRMYRHPGIVGEGADGLPLDIGGAGVRVQYHVVPIIRPAVAVATEQRGGSGQTIHMDGKRLACYPPGLGPGMIAHELGHRRGDAARGIIIRSKK